MKAPAISIAGLCVCLTLLLGGLMNGPVHAAQPEAPADAAKVAEVLDKVAPEAKAKAESLVKQLRGDMVVPGVALAEGVSEITGVAISPLLGMSAIGAWKYYDATPEMRSRLPWYCHPYAWGTGLAIIGLCFLKDFFGAATPALLKKPLDFAELFEDKASALVASTAFVPLVALAMSQVDRIQPQAYHLVAGSGLATLPLGGILDATLHTPWITVPLSMFAFAVVWMSSHAINVLIALSPFSLVDALLKLTKLSLLSLVAGSAALIPYSPIPALLVCSVLFLIGLLLAGWSFRLSLFGSLMGRDLLLNKRASHEGVAAGLRSFLARRTQGVPVRTLGRVQNGEMGQVYFVYRPWLLMPEKRVLITATSTSTLVVCRGILHPSLAHKGDETTRHRMAVILMPRYRRLEEKVAGHLGGTEIVDSPLLRGVKAVREWFRAMLSGNGRGTPANTAALPQG